MLTLGLPLFQEKKKQRLLWRRETRVLKVTSGNNTLPAFKARADPSLYPGQRHLLEDLGGHKSAHPSRAGKGALEGKARENTSLAQLGLRGLSVFPRVTLATHLVWSSAVPVLQKLFSPAVIPGCSRPWLLWLVCMRSHLIH